jgi:hypothetical protein
MLKSTKILTKDEVLTEFERQLQILISKKYYELTSLSVKDFTLTISKLKPLIENSKFEYGAGKLPFAIVFSSEFLDPELGMMKVLAKGKNGYTEMNPYKPVDFHPIVKIPEAKVYLIANIETGLDFLNISPANCLVQITQHNHQPLTMEEGVAVSSFFPEIFTDKTNFNAIQMPGSRIPNDQRVPSIWFSKGAPRLGWCWDNNIHSWLGSASCKHRLA